jgi:hypothetical protein
LAAYKHVELQIVVRLIPHRCFQDAAFSAPITTAESYPFQLMLRDDTTNASHNFFADVCKMMLQRVAAV